MKNLKIELDFSELTTELDEGGDFSIQELFIDSIRWEVRNQITALVRAQVRDCVEKYVSDELATDIKAEMKTHLRAFLQESKLPSAYGDLTVHDYLIEKFKHAIASDTSLIREVRDLAKSWGAELKRQYDVAYASKLVESLNEQGLLLPNVAQLLLDKSKS